ncbi:unnamed protein product [Ilex paraguariensis]
MGLEANRLVSMASKQQSLNIQAQALLAFKNSSVKVDPNGLLNSWDYSVSSNPCSWKGVICSFNAHVTDLNFRNGGLIGQLQMSDLLNIENLRHVDLHGNYFSGDLYFNNTVSSSPCVLEALDLSFNNLSESISDGVLVACDRLTSLNLSHNLIPGASLKFGASLLELDLSSNLISDFSTLNYSIMNCQNLNLLNFSGNRLTGRLGSLSSCKNLSVLDLSYNALSGVLPTGLIADSLKFLDLSNNNISGNFSELEFRNCSSLSLLNLTQNSLYGKGTAFPGSLRNCQLLERLDLSNNNLQGNISGSVLGELRNLRHLSLAQNQFFGAIPLGLGSICDTLEELDLSGNRLSGGLPLTFVSCSSLQSINLGNNQLSGDFLQTVISTLPNLKTLNIPFNNISGSVPLSLTNCSQLEVLDLSSNALVGNIPSGFCSSPLSSSLQNILLAGNFLSGTLPSELGKCKNLRTIDFSLNNISGTIPSEIWTLPNLSNLIMWGNNISGKIPEDICTSGGDLETLILNNNSIEGTIPSALTNCTELKWVALSHNRLTGKIPAGIGNLQNLVILQLDDNLLTGEIPPRLGECGSLVWLDLNSNSLTGSIPTVLAKQAGFISPRPLNVKYVFVTNEDRKTCRGAGELLEFNGIRAGRLARIIADTCTDSRMYPGMKIYSFSSNGSMIFLDLSQNFLSGSIPTSLGSLSYLQVLNLRQNELSGNIPYSLGGLKVIEILDLSDNQLEGNIPGSLGILSFLVDLDLSNNNLSGLIPVSGQLSTFRPSRYLNNSGLCGLPLPPCGSETLFGSTGDSKSDSENSSNPSKFDRFWVALVLGYGSGGIVGVVIGNWIFQLKYDLFVKTFIGGRPQRRKRFKRFKRN